MSAVKLEPVLELGLYEPVDTVVELTYLDRGYRFGYARLEDGGNTFVPRAVLKSRVARLGELEIGEFYIAEVVPNPRVQMRATIPYMATFIGEVDEDGYEDEDEGDTAS